MAGRSADELLVERKLIDADQLSRAIAERYGLDHVDLNVYNVDMGAANLLSAQAARRYGAVPVGYVDPKTLLLAIADPANVLAIDDIHMITGLNCKIAVAAADDIEALIGRLNTLERAVTEATDEERGGRARRDRRSCTSRPTTRRSSSSSTRSSARPSARAPPTSTSSPARSDMRVRFRVDGVLYEAARVPKRMVSGRDLAHQDHERARHRREARARRTAASASTSRTAGSTCASRPSRPSAGRGRRSASSTRNRPCARSTSSAWTASGRERLPRRRSGTPYGAVLVTGPTGSGKSTTLYASLARDQLGREEHHHDRGPGRVPDRRHQPDGRQPQGRARLRHRPALDAARRPRRDHGRRDPRRRDGADRDRGGADRPHGADDAAHQRRAGRDHPPAEDGHRVLPHRLGGRLRGRPAPGAQALPALQAAHRDLRRLRSPQPASASAPTSRPTSRSAARAATAPATGAGSASTR